jgi:hypothetical protein
MARYKREISIALAYAVLLGVLAVFAPRFFQGDKWRNIFVASAPVLVAAGAGSYAGGAAHARRDHVDEFRA